MAKTEQEKAPKPKSPAEQLVETGTLLLASVWKEVEVLAEKNSLPVHKELSASATTCFDGKEIAYKFAVITQCLGKASKHSLNALCLQEGSSVTGAWDARSFCGQVVVPWLRTLHSPFGAGTDPYVNNTLRSPEFSPAMRSQRKRSDLYDAAEKICQISQNTKDAAEAKEILRILLAALWKSLQGKEPTFAPPKRASIDSTIRAINDYLEQKSGGARLQAVVTGLYRAEMVTFKAIQEVRSKHVNTADAVTESAGDVELIWAGKLQRAVEVKDRPLTLAEFNASVTKARQLGINELSIVIRANKILAAGDEASIEKEKDKEFNGGLNVYPQDVGKLLTVKLEYLGEAGRVAFLVEVGNALKEQGVDYSQRVAWANIVRAM